MPKFRNPGNFFYGGGGGGPESCWKFQESNQKYIYIYKGFMKRFGALYGFVSQIWLKCFPLAKWSPYLIPSFLWMVTKTTFGFTSFVLPHELELEKVKHKLTSKLGAMPNRVLYFLQINLMNSNKKTIIKWQI